MNPLALARPDILAMAGYSSARLEASGGRIFLNANEAPEPPLADTTWNRYPDPQPAALVARLAALYGVTPDRVLVGRGSDESIDLLTRAFCRAGTDAVLVSPPTFGMYAVCARVQGAIVQEEPLDAEHGFAYPLAAVRARFDTPRTVVPKLVYVCAPNNPTGTPVPRAVIEQLLVATRGHALLVVDEAYGEFSQSASAAELLPQNPHLVVLRTLSKAHGLAGERIGTCLADPAVIGLLRKIMAPYPLPSGSVANALRVLQADSLSTTEDRIRQTLRERARLASALGGHPLVRAVLPSAGNFLCVRWTNADAVYAALSARGILVRQLQKYPGLGDALRISIGTPSENDAVLAALDALAGAPREAA